MVTSPRPKLRYEDLADFPDDGLRRELIDGEVYVTPSPSVRHQDIVLRLATAFAVHLESHGGGRVFVAPLDVLLGDHDVVEPDVIFVADAASDVIGTPNLRGVPSLLVEVVSDAARDLRLKRDRYERFGVPEYWAVLPDADRIEVYRLGPQGYGKPAIVEPGETLSPRALDSLTIDVAAILRRA